MGRDFHTYSLSFGVLNPGEKKTVFCDEFYRVLAFRSVVGSFISLPIQEYFKHHQHFMREMRVLKIQFLSGYVYCRRGNTGLSTKTKLSV